MLGSGGLAAENVSYPIGSVWVGSQAGQSINVMPEDISITGKRSVSPFGKAFYERKANYFVLPLSFIVIYNTLWQIFCSIYHNIAPVLAIYASIYWGHVSANSWIDEVAKIIVFYCVPIYCTTMLLGVSSDIAAKWLLLGRRKVGTYPWDQSSYCQRWQVYLTVQDIRRGDGGNKGILDLIQGSQYLVWYFRALGAKIGRDVCLYPNGGDPMMTEPDLVTIGDHCAVDDASLIAHINTRGIFRFVGCSH